MRFLIDRKITISMIFIALTFLGYISYKKLQVELLPSMEFPTMIVQIGSSNDYDPSYVESEVIVPLEGAIAKTRGVESISSTATSRGGSIIVSFKNSVNMKSTAIKFTEDVNEKAKTLPRDFRVSVNRANANQNANQFMTLSVKGEGDVDQIRAIAETELKTKLENIDGVVSVAFYGGKERAINIELQPELSDALGINAQTISGLLSSFGDERTFTGYASSVASRHSVFVEGGYDNVELIGDIVVADGPVFLRDIAIIRSDLKEPTTISRVDGKRAISVVLTGESGVNIIELSERTKAEIAKLNELFAIQGVSIVVENNSAEEIEENIDKIGVLGILGAFLAIIILWFSLHNLRLVLCIALSIPISIFATFNFFYAFDITINSYTLIGISLAVGMLLDNSIVVLENIYRLYMKGYTAANAVMDGTRQVWRSIIAATLTTITVFLPFVFTDNIFIATIGRNLGIAIISTLFFSLIVALLLIPMITYVILNRGRGRSLFSEKISIHERSIQIYTIVLKSVIRQPAIVITTMMVVLMITFAWAMGQSADDGGKSVKSDQIMVSVKMPSGSTISSSDKVVELLEAKLDSLPERKELRSMVNEDNATLTLSLNEDINKRGARSMGEIINDVSRRLRVQGLEVMVTSGSSTSSGGGSGSNEGLSSLLGMGGGSSELAIKGSDYQTMIRIGDDLKERLSALDFISNVSVSVQPAADQIELGFDPIMLNSLGISQQQISEGLTGLSSEHSSGTEIRFGDELIDITITSETPDTSLTAHKSLKSLTELKEILIKGSANSLYQLDHIASIRKDKGKGNVKREDRSRELKIRYRLTESEGLPDDIKRDYESQIDQTIAEYPMPSGIAVERVEKEDDLSDFKFLILASLILIFMILAAVFESLSTPFVLLFAIPLAAIGSLVALILSGNSLFNINTMTGFLILLGVVVNGGIILIDYVNILRKKGYCRNRALLSGGASRLRPIMITTVTTVIALLPMALGDNQTSGLSIGAPFAITVIGGLLFSSVLTLVLIPTLYMSMENILKWYRELPRWIHLLHLLIFVGMIAYIAIVPDSMVIQIVYTVLTVTLIPAITYFIRTSVRIANSDVISPTEPITITIRNLVKIYDRPGRLKREWMGAKSIRRRLGLDSDCKSVSDMKDLLWKSVIAVFCFGMGLIYFENGLWITLMFVLWAMITISMWNKYWKYYQNKKEENNLKPRRLMRILSRSFNYIIAIIALSMFSYSGGSGGVTTLYVLMLLSGLLLYRLARRVEKRGINVERINGRFSALRRAMYGMALSMPIIGKKKVPFMALKGVSFTINTGMFGLLGPNGAGKSTLMRIVTGIYEQSYGTVWINDKDTLKYREELQSLIGFLPQEFGTYEMMSAWDFLNYQAILKGLTNTKLRTERLEYVLNAVHMFEKKDINIGSFSGGMKQRIGIALILLNLPRILVVDEPTAGLDPRERIRFRNLLVELSRDRIVIFSTHIIEDIASSCNQMAIINKGELRYYGAPNEMLSFAKDKVWSFMISEAEFKNLDHSLVVNHMREGDNLRIRYISTEKPNEDAQMEIPLLEDAYLCLLKNL